MRDIGFLAIFFVAIFPALTHIQVAVMLWVWVTLLAPNSYFFSTGSLIPYTKVAVGITLASLIFSRGKKALRFDRTTLLIALFLITAALSQTFALHESQLGWDLLDKLWKIVVLNIGISSFMRSRTRLHAMTIVICNSLAVMSFSSGLKLIASGGSYKVVTFQGWGDNNHIGLIVLMGIPLLRYLSEYSEEKILRIGALIGIVLSILCVLATNSRGAFIGLLVLTLLIIASVSNRRHRIRYLLAVVAIGAALSPLLSQQWVDRMHTIQTADQDSSMMGRVIAWKLSTLIALEHPFLGGGLHNLQILPTWSAYREQVHVLSFIPTDEPDVRPHAAHSIYFELLGDTGFTGLIIFSNFRYASWIIRNAHSRPDIKWAGALARDLRLGLIVFMVSGAALSASYHDLNFIFFGMLSALRGTVIDIDVRKPSSRSSPASLEV